MSRVKHVAVIVQNMLVHHFLESVDSLKHRTLLTIAYAAGLRVSEATHLKVTDIGSQRMMLRVDQGKGHFCTVCPHCGETRNAVNSPHSDALRLPYQF